MGSNLVSFLFSKYPNYKLIVLDALTYAGNTDNFSRSVWDSPRFKFHYGDIRNANLVDALISQADIVVHLAAETHVTRSINDNLAFFETDVLGTHTIANAVLRNKNKIERFIHISTSEVYGTAVSRLMREEHPLSPMSPYASAKAGADRLVWSYWATYQIPTIIIRPFNNYGPHQHLEKLIPRFITSCLLDEPLTVHGDGKSKRDWLFVGDFCRGVDRAVHGDINKLRGEVINIGTSKSYDINTIAQMVLKLAKKPSDMVTYIDNRPGQVFRHTASIKKAKELLNWKPMVDFSDGIEKTIAWYKAHPGWWKKRVWLKKITILTPEGKEILH